MQLPFDTLIYWVAFLVSVVALYITILLRATHRDDWINELRRIVLPGLDTIARQRNFYAMTKVDRKQFVGVVDAPVDEVEVKLENIGGVRNFASSLKVQKDGDYESSSYALRESKRWWLPDMVALRQTHVILFELGNKTEMYAHEEYNSLLPVVGLLHYRGHTFNAERGVVTIRRKWNDTYPNLKIVN